MYLEFHQTAGTVVLQYTLRVLLADAFWVRDPPPLLVEHGVAEKYKPLSDGLTRS